MDHTHSNLFTRQNYMKRYIGGTNQNRNISQQQNIIKNQNQYQINFDPHIDFLYKKGLVGNGINTRRYITKYINIDSSFRNKRTINETDECFLLNENPLVFKKQSNLVFINHKNHNYKIGDKIIISEVAPIRRVLRSLVNDKPSFEILKNCNFMKIFLNNHKQKENLEVVLEGIKGDRGKNNSYLGNVPINIINSKHKIKLELTESDITCNILPDNYLDSGSNHFFIILPKTMTKNYTLKEYNYKLFFLSINGIPINLLNLDHFSNKQKCHNILNIQKNGYTVKINTKAVDNTEGGGSCVHVCKILSTTQGFPNPNNYIIDLGQTIHDIIFTRLVSIEFPNSGHIINYENNKLYWNNIDDFDHLYNITVPPGNYTPDVLSNVLEKLFYDVHRINAGEEIGSIYEPNHIMKVKIDIHTDIVQFVSYKKYYLTEPFITVTPEIPQTKALDNNPPDTKYALTIKHPGHSMTKPGEKIIINNAISHLGIPIKVLNGEHKVSNIINDNSYNIILKRFNTNDIRMDTKGGVNVVILIPDFFRFRFDKKHTIGKLLGFRNISYKKSITPYKRIITNKDLYEFEPNSTLCKIKNNSIQLMKKDYVLMVAKPLKTLTSIGPIKSAFAKILPHNLPFDNFVRTKKYYEDPLHELSKLEISFHKPDGKLYNFNGVDHSFTIEIVTISDIPEGTGISPNTGKNYYSKPARVL